VERIDYETLGSYAGGRDQLLIERAKEVLTQIEKIDAQLANIPRSIWNAGKIRSLKIKHNVLMKQHSQYMNEMDHYMSPEDFALGCSRE